MNRGGGRQPGHGGGPDRLACCARAFALRELCRAACGRWGAGATFAQQNGDSGAPGTRQGQGVNRPGRARSDLSPLSPLNNGLSPRSMGTDFSNGDKGLGQLSRVVPTVPTKFESTPRSRPPQNPRPNAPATRCPGTGGDGPAGEWGVGGTPLKVLPELSPTRVIRTA